jgi:hypothetical protein
MRKAVLVLVSMLLLTLACSIPTVAPTPTDTSTPLLEVTETPTPTITPTEAAPWPAVTGPDPSPRVGAFYYPWYFNPEFDGRWDHWGEGQFDPPLSIASDYYPVMGAYSQSDPALLAQHFAWMREAGVGLIISSWWGQGDPTDRALPLMLDVADHYGVKIAFHIENYGGRTAESLIDDVHYIYDRYGDHPAFFWTNETSRYSSDDLPKGLFFLWASVAPDGDSPAVEPSYWQGTLDTLHVENPGAIVLTDQNDPRWVVEGHFDGAYKYGVLDTDQSGYNWALSMPAGAWYVPGINPGFSARRIGYEDWVDTPRRDGDTYDDRWERMFAVGVEPALVAVTTFNEWHEGTQIEPAAAGVITPDGFTYLDYGALPPDGYLTMTREWAEVFLAYEWPDTVLLRLRMLTTSDWTNLHLVSGAAWQGPELISTGGEDPRAGIHDGILSLGQPLDLAEAGQEAEVLFELQFREEDGETPVVFEIERGHLGATWVELFRLSGEEWILAASFIWDGINPGERNASSFEVDPVFLFGEQR